MIFTGWTTRVMEDFLEMYDMIWVRACWSDDVIALTKEPNEQQVACFCQKSEKKKKERTHDPPNNKCVVLMILVWMCVSLSCGVVWCVCVLRHPTR